MVDSRFVEESDVLGSLDQRPNLMELSPTEFESLITNLFSEMGLTPAKLRPPEMAALTVSRSIRAQSSAAA